MISQGGCAVAVIKYTDAELDLLARLMRAEAEGDGQLGMLLVGNVGVNRVRSDASISMIFEVCRIWFFKVLEASKRRRNRIFISVLVRWIEIWQGALSTANVSLRRTIIMVFHARGDCPAQWYNQWNTGRFKSHCFFSPTVQDCPNL